MALTLDTPGATTGTFSGGGTLTTTQIADMLANNTYIRIASQVWPSGELRGQLYQSPGVPVPAAVCLFGSGLLVLIGVARRKAA